MVIVDYGMGNLRSVLNRLQQTGVSCCLSANSSVIGRADALVLPGVGHFGKAMERLRRQGLLNLLNDRVLGDRVPIMGICLGMQLLTDSSEEGNAAGLGWIKGKVCRLQPTNATLKVPHIGWNNVQASRLHPILEGLSSQELFYFVHSYHVELANEDHILHTSHYGHPFVSALQKDNIVGFQYHPEKSQDAGLVLFRNFANLVKDLAHV
ncbi:imidazole glycerol phosphate synthase subunit HisH [Microvirga pudoricolor]|uniref:imidazole glycerol phosphate synthase subunit HisH n=1 Tax=Microvirga pudoricolor TaxID=2778729 RepID=UPI0019521F5C|nr:imidazole glycerol phosphate synthase subunit HisH [Microvirga pudoricolor]MBM6593016.1 imidazole glycerol phosphate synthase subunit HisH [Microvirga pudoricolor]